MVEDGDPRALALERGRLRRRRSRVGHQRDRRRRGVVGGQHPGRPGRSGGVADRGVEQPLDVLGGDAAGAQQLRRIGRAVDDRALDADRARAAVEHDVALRVEVRPEVGEDVLGGRRADPAEAVRRRRGDAPPRTAPAAPASAGEPGTRSPTVSRPPVTASRTRLGAGQQQRQRSRPARVGEDGGAAAGRRPPTRRASRGRCGRSAGWSAGRSLAAKIRPTAAADRRRRHRGRTRSRWGWRPGRRGSAGRRRRATSVVTGTVISARRRGTPARRR